MSFYSHNPHYEGAMNRQRQLEGMRGTASGQVKSSPGETMRRLQNRNNTPLGPTVTVPVAMGNAMQQQMESDRIKAAQARLNYRRDRARYLLGG